GSSELEALEEPGVNLVAILTRHEHHARQTVLALKHNKHVYCEKPLAVNKEQLDEVFGALHPHRGRGGQSASSLLTVGFNRRFAPFAVKLKAFF
ncbi:MAG: Gfo/Idh/MocA family oxidoreductase, partial [Anaerolineaceae bacterium]|nr:Gfo/Idh/MocA family oxidoreductase [Anaerolineaceae bacterium]